MIKTKYKLPLSKAELKKLTPAEQRELKLIEKHWTIEVVLVNGETAKKEDVDLSVSKEQGFEVAAGAKCSVCEGRNIIEMTERGADTGIFRWGYLDCECQRWVFLNKYLDTNLPPKYRKVDLDALKPNPTSKLSILRQEKEILRLQRDWNKGKGFFFLGKAGTSKTTYMIALWRKHLEANIDFMRDPFKNGINFMWRVDAQTLLEQYLEKEMNRTEAPEPEVRGTKIAEVRKKYGIRPVLILEEIDKLKTTKFKLDKLFEIINALYENEGILILSTNLSLNQFQSFFGPTLMRRIVEMCYIRDYYQLEGEKEEVLEGNKTTK